MRAPAIAVAFLFLALSGCFGGTDDGAPDEPADPPADAPPDASDPAPEPDPQPEPEPSGPPGPGPTGSIEGFVRDPDGPVEGADVAVVGTDLRARTDDGGGFRIDDVPTGEQVVRATHAPSGRSAEAAARVPEGGSDLVFIDLPDVEGPPSNGPELEPVAPRPDGYVFSCGGETVVEPAWNHGKGDPVFPELTWAAVKTGFRFAVLLPGQGEATLAYRSGLHTGTVTSVDGWFVLEGLDVGRDMCFSVTAAGKTSATHAARLVNGPTSFDAVTGTYTLNLLVLAAERPVRSELEGGLEVYAETMWDATDGLVRPGVVMLMYGGPGDMDDSYEPCSTPGASFIDPPWETLLCDKVFDVGITYFVSPQAAASTYRDGIDDDRLWIRMNAIFEANPLLGYTYGDDVEVGRVLLHELGHYAFGMMDMYTDGNSCYDADLGLSVMGSSRQATEFDDKDHPCPNASTLEDYVPAWTDFMARYDAAKPRPGGPLEGPEGGAEMLVLTIIDRA